MLRVMQITEDEWSFIWAKIAPMSRRSAEWIGTDNVILNDEEGPILLTIGRVEVIRDIASAPVKVKRWLDKFKQSSVQYDGAGNFVPKERAQ